MNTRVATCPGHVAWLAGLILGLAGLAAAAADAEPQRVLLLHSFGREFEPFATFSEAFRTELARRSGAPLDCFDMAFESARFNGESGEEPFVNYVLALFKNRRLDLIVPIGGPAALLAQKHRQRLFPQTPMLFAAVDERHLRNSALTTNDAVVSVRHDPAALVESILRVCPATTNIAVVFGASSLEQFWVEQLRLEFQRFTNQVAFTWWNDMPFADTLSRAARLPQGWAIFYGHMSVDAGGIPHVEERALDELHAVAAAPIFGVHDYQLGQGIVGGPLASVRHLAQQSALAAVRVLAGTSPDAIRPPPMGMQTPVYDRRELQRWGINSALLPPGSQVQFVEPAAGERYRWRIVTYTTLCLVEALLISVLLANRFKRKRAERSLLESRNRLRSILDTAVEGIISIDEHGVIESVNPTAEKMFGYTATEMVGQPAAMLMPPQVRGEHGPHPSHYGQAKPLKPIGAGSEATGRRKNGSVFPMELAVSETTLGGRRIYTEFVRDITERKEAEQVARAFGSRLIRAQEEERARLARELHDDITQRLARLAIDAGRAGLGGAGTPMGDTMRGVCDGLVQLSQDVHSLAYKLHPSLVEDLGLADAIKAECERFAQWEALPIDVSLESIPPAISRGAGLCLFRVAQEALRNAARHARAPRAALTLRLLEGGLQLAVTDCGVGFDPSQQRHRPSLGLASMRERVQSLGGELDVESAPGHGTTIVAWVPLNGEAS